MVGKGRETEENKNIITDFFYNRVNNTDYLELLLPTCLCFTELLSIFWCLYLKDSTGIREKTTRS